MIRNKCKICIKSANFYIGPKRQETNLMFDNMLSYINEKGVNFMKGYK